MPEQHCAQHYIFRQTVFASTPPLTHSALSVPATTRSRSVWSSSRTRCIEQVCAILISDTGGADRAIERQAGDTQSSKVPSNAGISGSTSGLSDMTVQMIWTSLVKPLGNRGRTGRSIRRRPISPSPPDDPPGEKTARNLAGGVGLLLIVDGHWKEIPPLHPASGADYGTLNNCTIHIDHNRTVSLTRDFASLQRHFMNAVLKLFLIGVTIVSSII